MNKYEFECVKEDDPNRCQGVNSKGQCFHKAVPGSKFCPAHGGNAALAAQEARQKYMYNLTKFHARFADFATDPAIKTLREEIGVMRMMLETIINRCTDAHELMLASTQISSMVSNIEKLVVSANKLEIHLGQLLDRNKAIQLADELVQIITAEVSDEDTVNKIAIQITAAMNRITLSEP